MDESVSQLLQSLSKLPEPFTVHDLYQLFLETGFKAALSPETSATLSIDPKLIEIINALKQWKQCQTDIEQVNEDEKQRLSEIEALGELKNRQRTLQLQFNSLERETESTYQLIHDYQHEEQTNSTIPNAEFIPTDLNGKKFLVEKMQKKLREDLSRIRLMRVKFAIFTCSAEERQLRLQLDETHRGLSQNLISSDQLIKALHHYKDEKRRIEGGLLELRELLPQLSSLYTAEDMGNKISVLQEKVEKLNQSREEITRKLQKSSLDEKTKSILQKAYAEASDKQEFLARQAGCGLWNQTLGAAVTYLQNLWNGFQDVKSSPKTPEELRQIQSMEFLTALHEEYGICVQIKEVENNLNLLQQMPHTNSSNQPLNNKSDLLEKAKTALNKCNPDNACSPENILETTMEISKAIQKFSPVCENLSKIINLLESLWQITIKIDSYRTDWVLTEPVEQIMTPDQAAQWQNSPEKDEQYRLKLEKAIENCKVFLANALELEQLQLQLKQLRNVIISKSKFKTQLELKINNKFRLDNLQKQNEKKIQEQVRAINNQPENFITPDKCPAKETTNTLPHPVQTQTCPEAESISAPLNLPQTTDEPNAIQSEKIRAILAQLDIQSQKLQRNHPYEAELLLQAKQQFANFASEIEMNRTKITLPLDFYKTDTHYAPLHQHRGAMKLLEALARLCAELFAALSLKKTHKNNSPYPFFKTHTTKLLEATEQCLQACS